MQAMIYFPVSELAHTCRDNLTMELLWEVTNIVVNPQIAAHFVMTAPKKS